MIKTRKFRSFIIFKASRKAQGFTPSFRGGVWGNENAWTPMMMEKPPARRSISPLKARPLVDWAPIRHRVRRYPAAIQPTVPQTRILPNSFSEFWRLMKAMELVRARVGAYRKQ